MSDHSCIRGRRRWAGIRLTGIKRSAFAQAGINRGPELLVSASEGSGHFPDFRARARAHPPARPQHAHSSQPTESVGVTSAARFLPRAELVERGPDFAALCRIAKIPVFLLTEAPIKT